MNSIIHFDKSWYIKIDLVCQPTTLFAPLPNLTRFVLYKLDKCTFKACFFMSNEDFRLVHSVNQTFHLTGYSFVFIFDITIINSSIKKFIGNGLGQFGLYISRCLGVYQTLSIFDNFCYRRLKERKIIELNIKKRWKVKI